MYGQLIIQTRHLDGIVVSDDHKLIIKIKICNSRLVYILYYTIYNIHLSVYNF